MNTSSEPFLDYTSIQLAVTDEETGLSSELASCINGQCRVGHHLVRERASCTVVLSFEGQHHLHGRSAHQQKAPNIFGAETPQELFPLLCQRNSVLPPTRFDCRGGVRLPDVDVPTASHRGVAADGSLVLTGSTTPFSDEMLRALYPTRGTYCEKYRMAVAGAVDAGVLLPRDAALMLAGLGDAAPWTT